MLTCLGGEPGWVGDERGNGHGGASFGFASVGLAMAQPMNALQRHIQINELYEVDTMSALADGCYSCPDVAVWARDVGAESARRCVNWLRQQAAAVKARAFWTKKH